MSITFTKKSLWVNQAPCFNFELNEDELLDKALKENFVIKIEEDLYELNLDHNSFENVSPGIKPLFFNQNMEQNAPEKKIPSTAANAINLSGNVALFLSSHLNAHSAFFLTAGIVSIALNNLSFSVSSLM